MGDVMQALLMLLAVSLVSLGWWTTTLRSFELQAVVGAQLILFGAIFAVLGLLHRQSDERRN